MVGTRLVRQIESLSQVHGLQLSAILEGVGVVVDKLGALEDDSDVGLVARGNRAEEEVCLQKKKRK